MKLYYIPTTRAVRPRWLLEEMNISYDLVRVTPEMSRQPEYNKLHPHGKVPILVDEDVIIYESAAICAYLADKYPEKEFAPSCQSPARAYYYQWLFYSSLTLEAPVEQYMFHVLPYLPDLASYLKMGGQELPKKKLCNGLRKSVNLLTSY